MFQILLLLNPTVNIFLYFFCCFYLILLDLKSKLIIRLYLMYKKDFLAKNIRRAREAEGDTLEDLSKKLGYIKPSSFSTVGKWENG